MGTVPFGNCEERKNFVQNAPCACPKVTAFFLQKLLDSTFCRNFEIQHLSMTKLFFFSIDRENRLCQSCFCIMVELPRSNRTVQAVRPQTTSACASAVRYKKALNTQSRQLSTYQRLS